MKYFMQYRTEVAYVIDQPKEQRYGSVEEILSKSNDCTSFSTNMNAVNLCVYPPNFF